MWLVCRAPHPRYPARLHDVPLAHAGDDVTARATGRLLAVDEPPAEGCVSVVCVKCKRATEYRVRPCGAGP